MQFHERFFPVTKIGASTPVAISHTGVVQGRLRGQLEQQCKGHLRHRLGAVAGDIGHRNIAGGRCAGVYDIITGGEHADIAQLGQGLDDLGGYECFISEHNFRAGSPFGYLRGRCAIVYGQVAQRAQRVPRQIARIQGVAVEHDNARGSGVHGANLAL